MRVESHQSSPPPQLILFSLDDKEHVLRLDSIMPNERKGLSGRHPEKSLSTAIGLILN
jgi:hypothetical protein